MKLYFVSALTGLLQIEVYMVQYELYILSAIGQYVCMHTQPIRQWNTDRFGI